jgi:hypothetical protein
MKTGTAKFNHIDIEHFKKGERGQDWRFPSSSLVGDEMNQTVPTVFKRLYCNILGLIHLVAHER